MEKALELIPKTDSVSWGGVMTVDELGLMDRLAQEGLYPHRPGYRQGPGGEAGADAPGAELRHVSDEQQRHLRDGQLVNIDGMGNRVAAMCYGPGRCVVIAGMNKVLGTLDDAIARAGTSRRRPTRSGSVSRRPCGLTGQCGDCASPDCICSYVVVTRNSMVHERIKVILVGGGPGAVKRSFAAAAE